MNTNISFRISRIPRQEKYIACYKRGWRSQWTHYKQHGTFHEFPTWDSAFDYLCKRYTPAFVGLHLVSDIPSTYERQNVDGLAMVVKKDQKQPGTDVPTLFDYLCDAAIAHK